MNKAEEKEIISLLRQNDKSALKVIFTHYHSLLCQVSYNVLQDKHEAKDVVQDVFYKLWRRRNELTIDTSLYAYLKRAVVNTSINVLEKQKRFSKTALTNCEEADFASQEGDQEHLASELSFLADKAINDLPPRTQAVFRLIRFEEMSYKEVAERLNISLKAVEKEMMKALRLLRLALKDYLPFLLFCCLIKAIYFISEIFS